MSDQPSSNTLSTAQRLRNLCEHKERKDYCVCCTAAAELESHAHEPLAEWRPIATAPESGNFQICLETCPHLSWPAHADEGNVYSNAHGLLNKLDEHGRITVATHWRPAHSPPTKEAEQINESALTGRDASPGTVADGLARLSRQGGEHG